MEDTGLLMRGHSLRYCAFGSCATWQILSAESQLLLRKAGELKDSYSELQWPSNTLQKTGELQERVCA